MMLSISLLALIATAEATPKSDTAVKQAACTVIKSQESQVVLRGNVISTPGILPDNDCLQIELPEGAVLAPAFIHANTGVGLTEVSLEGSTNDSSSGLSGDIHAAFSPFDGYNPRSSLIPIARLEGVGTVIVVPRSGLIAGHAAAFDLTGESQAQAVAKKNAAMVANLGAPSGGSRADAFYRIREVLDDATTYRRKKAAYEQGRLRELSASRLDLLALQPVIQGKTPLMVNANRASEIEAVLRLAKELDLKLIISGGSEAWMHAKALADANVPVLIDPMQYGVQGFASIHARPDNAALLEKAGVKVILMHQRFESHNARKLRQAAGNAVREGMSHQGAIDAISTNVAEAFGLQHHGRLAPGSVANVVAWSGDPLEISSQPLYIWIQGKQIPLTSRQTHLLEKYRTIKSE